MDPLSLGAVARPRTSRPLSPALKRLRRAIGRAIQTRRQAGGLTQVALAKRAKLHPMTVVQLERGGQTPSLDILCRLARVLEIAPEDLLQDAVTLTRSRARAPLHPVVRRPASPSRRAFPLA